MSDIEAEAMEALRLSRTVLEIIQDYRAEPEVAAHRLVVLLHTLTRAEALSLGIVLAATTATILEMAAQVIVKFTSDLTRTDPPDWVAPRITEDLRKFISESLDPERQEVRDLIHGMFEEMARERNQKDG